MPIKQLETRKILKVRIDGRWNISLWNNLLQDIDDLYNFLLIIKHLVSEINKTDLMFSIDQDEELLKLYNSQIADLNLYLRSLRSSLEYISFVERPIAYWKGKSESDLSVYGLQEHYILVRKIRYGSPGWIELLGNLNIFKVIADAIAAKRKEDTDRIKIAKQHEIDQVKIANQHEIDQKKLEIDNNKIESDSIIEQKKIKLEGARLRSSERIENNKLKAQLLTEILKDINIPDQINKPEQFDLNVDRAVDAIVRKINMIDNNPMVKEIGIAKSTKSNNKKALKK